MLKRPQSRSLMFAFSLAVALMLILSACGATGTPTTSTTPTTGAPVKGGTWIDDLYEEPHSFIPNGSSETFAVLVDQSIFAPLFYGDSQGMVHPGLATEIPSIANGDVTADLKNWTIKLRPNLVWSDGQQLNADDVDFTWRLWDNKKFGAYSTVGYNLITSADVSADKLSITFHLSSPFEPFVSIWTDGGFAPLPKHVFASMAPESILKSPESLKPSVSSGPFIMSDSKPGDHFTVVKNPKYYRASEGLPYLDSIVFRIVPDLNTALKDIQAGSINSAWFLDVSNTAAYKAVTNYKLVKTPGSAGFEAMYFNFNDPVLAKNVDVRKAMSMAIDHNALITVARRGSATPLCTDHSMSFNPGYQADAACPTFDQAAANTLLDQDGWTKGADGVRSKNGQRLEFLYSTTANNPWRAADELIIQSDLKAIGIKLNIQNYPAGTFFGTVLPTGKTDKYQLAEFENTFTYDADDSPLLSCTQIPTAANTYSGGNYSFYCNHAMDPLFAQELGTTDTTVRQDAFNKIHAIELTDFPFITYYAPQDIAMAKLNVHNYTPGPMGASETVNVWTWWCDGGKC